MTITLSPSKSIASGKSAVYLIRSQKDVNKLPLSTAERKYLGQTVKEKEEHSTVQQLGIQVHICFVATKSGQPLDATREKLRRIGAKICDSLNAGKEKVVHISGQDSEMLMAIAEGIALRNYQFLKYRKDKKEKTHSLNKIVLHGSISRAEIDVLNALIPSIYDCKDLVNEPLSYLTAPQLGKEIKKLGKTCGFKAEVLGKKKIESLKMGGLLAVNKGSLDDPTFSILEWKPKKVKNKRPLVLVGKGVVYDTGGLSLKPTPNSMDMMKCDMAGAAMMIGTMAAVSRAKLPLHIIALIPASDNRPGGNAYAPGDIVNMYDGTTVEVLNTDAEGRMLLADALAYAKKYKPELVLDAATLTGAAVRAIGSGAACVMGTAEEKDFSQIEKSGYATHERVARMPFWDDYGQQMKSDIADLKNLGGPEAGHITAGKFLEHFTDYPWIHLDIAGPAYITSEDSYRGKWATGYGVRLLFDFLRART